LCIGQEAIPVGVEHSITPDDAIITAYRCHGFAYMRRVSVYSILAELMGKKTGCSLGKGGSMHLFGPQFYGGNGIVGAQVPVGAGIAFAQKYKNPDNKNIAIALYGDGAANQGQVFEAYNMAKLWNLPCNFICENNLYGMGTSAERSSASTDYYKRAGYIPGLRVDGMDVFAVKEALRYGKQWILDGNGPLVMEMKTYRYSGHSMSDPGTTYRTREEVQTTRETRDPLLLLQKKIIESGIATEEQLKALEKEIREQVEIDAEKAKQDPEPNTDQLFKDIYVANTSDEIDIKGCDTDRVTL
jgi:pyruvate dehydrogenase E1 component alpha subunit